MSFMVLQRKKLIVMCLVVVSLLTLVACNSEDVPKQNLIKVETPYCVLCLPGEFNEKISWNVLNEDPYNVVFSSAKDNTELFSITFNEKQENLLGTLVLEEEDVAIYYDFAELDEESDTYEEYCRYQEGINTIAEYLVADYEFNINKIVDRNEGKTYDIETSVATLKYPLRWENVVDVEVAERSASFSYREVLLFKILFYENEGDLLGEYNGTPVSVVFNEIEQDNYSSSEYDEICWMQEDVNVIIQNLNKDKQFKMAE